MLNLESQFMRIQIFLLVNPTDPSNVSWLSEWILLQYVELEVVDMP